MTGFVIFTYDNNSDVHHSAKFYRFIDTLRAMGKLRGKVVKTFGMYDGLIEDSFIVRRDDFFDHILDSGFVGEQEPFLMVPASNKQPVSLYYQQTGEYESLGRMKTSVSIPSSLGWTYRPDIKLYFCV